MIPEKVLYTDGHEVTVTDTFFRVKKALYYLNGITRHGLLIIHPYRLAPFLALLLGAMLITTGAMHLIPVRTIPNIVMFSNEISANAIALGLGIILFVAGLLGLSFMRDRYAIRIVTAEGEKNVLVSPRREYITQVGDALNKAFRRVVSPKHEKIRWINRKK
jgi:hypothetical protein